MHSLFVDMGMLGFADEEDYFKEDDDEEDSSGSRVGNGVARPAGGVTGGFSLSSLVEYGEDDDEELDALRNGSRDGEPRFSILKHLCPHAWMRRPEAMPKLGKAIPRPCERYERLHAAGLYMHKQMCTYASVIVSMSTPAGAVLRHVRVSAGHIPEARPWAAARIARVTNQSKAAAPC